MLEMLPRSVFASLLIFVCAGLAQADQPTAKAAMTAWLKDLDAEQYADSWEAAAPMFQAQVSREQWQQMAAKARQPLGALVSRELTAAEYKSALPGAPPADYVIFVFTADYAERSGTTETVTAMLVDGAWRGVGYFIR